MSGKPARRQKWDAAMPSAQSCDPYTRGASFGASCFSAYRMVTFFYRRACFNAAIAKEFGAAHNLRGSCIEVMRQNNIANVRTSSYA